MRRQDGGAGRGARGREDVRTSRARAVPGPRPEALGPPARSSLMVRSPWLCPMLKGPAAPKRGRGLRVLRESQQPPEARPGCRKTPPWRAERRGHLRNEMLTHGNTGAPFGAPHPRYFEGKEIRSWLARGRKQYGRWCVRASLSFPLPAPQLGFTRVGHLECRSRINPTSEGERWPAEVERRMRVGEGPSLNSPRVRPSPGSQVLATLSP